MLELWLLAARRREWRPVRPETVAMVLVGASYALALLTISNYFADALPLVLLAYGATGAPRALDLLQPLVLIALAMLGLVVTHPRLLRADRSDFCAALTVAAAGFAVAYFIQDKGW